MNPCAGWSKRACWKLINHMEEFVNGEAVLNHGLDAVACAWGKQMIRHAWDRIGELDNEVRRATKPGKVA